MRLTPRGVVVSRCLIAAAFAAAAWAGLNAEAWSPCAAANTVCVVEVAP